MKKPAKNVLMGISVLFPPLLLGMANYAKSGWSSNKLNPQVLKLALKAEDWAVQHGQVKDARLITIVDYSRPSSEKRLWVIRLSDHRVLMNLPVSHGKGSGGLRAIRFSNQSRSYESSLGVYLTEGTYRGRHGLSVRLKGLESQINDNAEKRAIVMHSAWYMQPKFLKQHGYYGRSWGCFAVNPEISNRLFNLIKGGSVIFAYAAPEKYDPNLN